MGENKYISIIDDYSSCTNDSINKNEKDDRRPKGYVEVYELNDEEADEENLKNIEKNGKFIGSYNIKKPKRKKNNLIVFGGREWIASAMFGVDNSNITPLNNDKIYWIGFGDGGSPEEDPFNPTNPLQDDSELSSPIMVNEEEKDHGDFRNDPESGYYKKILYDVEFEQDDLNDDKYLVVKVVSILTFSDANDSVINEAGLFIASEDSDGYNGDFTLFSKVTFPSISKTSNRQLVFNWYVYT